MSFQHKTYNSRFLATRNGSPHNNATEYGVRIRPAEIGEGESYWKVIGVHHLAPEENRSRHNAYIEALDESGQRVRDPNLKIGWTWEGRQADQRADPKNLDKPDSEPAGDVPIQKGMNLEVWLEGNGSSDRVQNMHTRHPDEPTANGDKWNTFGHHSYYVVFQRTRKAAESGSTKSGSTGNGSAGSNGTDTITKPITTVTGTKPNYYPDFIYGIHESGGEQHMLDADRPGWVLELAAIGLDGNNTHADFSHLARRSLGVIVRINHGYGSTGTLPTGDKYKRFAQACARYVARSRGCHIWIIGNEPNHAQEWPDGQPITPQQYVRAYKLCRDAIYGVSGHENDQVLVAGPAPWNIETKYDINPSGDWGKYFTDTLDMLGAGECDGLAIHTYTRHHDPSRIKIDVPFGNPAFKHLRDEFRTYQDFMERIPERFRQLPVFITETDPTDPNVGWEPAENRGWIRTAYEEIADWNSNSTNQPIQALILYRWPETDQKQWSISNRPGIIEDFKQAVRVEPADRYRVRVASTPKVVAPTTLLPTHQQRRGNVVAELGLRMRTGPSTQHPDITILPHQTAVTMLAQVGEWVFVETGGQRGYVSSQYVDFELSGSTATTPATGTSTGTQTTSVTSHRLGRVNAQYGLTLRSGPGTEHNAMTILPNTTIVDILAVQGDWYHVQAAGQTGYVFAQYVSLLPQIPAASPMEVLGSRGLSTPSALPLPGALPMPTVPTMGGSTGGKTLAETDPDLYEAWADHIKKGFKNNNVMFNDILRGFMHPYYTTIWMYRILFAIGIASFVVAAGLSIWTQNASFGLVFGGLSVAAFVSYFLSRPLQALEENLQFITWLGIVYNTYWTRLLYTMDHATAHENIEDATNDAVREIERLLDKHAERTGKRPNV